MVVGCLAQGAICVCVCVGSGQMERREYATSVIEASILAITPHVKLTTVVLVVFQVSASRVAYILSSLEATTSGFAFFSFSRASA